MSHIAFQITERGDAALFHVFLLHQNHETRPCSDSFSYCFLCTLLLQPYSVWTIGIAVNCTVQVCPGSGEVLYGFLPLQICFSVTCKIEQTFYLLSLVHEDTILFFFSGTKVFSVLTLEWQLHSCTNSFRQTLPPAACKASVATPIEALLSQCGRYTLPQQRWEVGEYEACTGPGLLAKPDKGAQPGSGYAKSNTLLLICQRRMHQLGSNNIHNKDER